MKTTFKYRKREVMRAAWRYYRNTWLGYSFSEALKRAWADEKAAKVRHIAAILVDEKEVVRKYVAQAKEANKKRIDGLDRKLIEFGLNPRSYAGGLTCVKLEEFLNNLMAEYIGNYPESIFFQCDSIKKDEILSMICRYLKIRGLEKDFEQFKSGAVKQEYTGLIELPKRHEKEMALQE
jgi:hypothetical protein